MKKCLNPNQSNKLECYCKFCKHRLNKKKYYQKNKSHINQRHQIWANKNQVKVKNYNKQYYLRNKEKIDKRNKEWAKNNPAKHNAINMNRLALKLKATPKWLTKTQLKEIEQFYIQAYEMTQETGIQYEVDHIIPLKGYNINGLHVPWNLQIITKTENISKGNRCVD